MLGWCRYLAFCRFFLFVLILFAHTFGRILFQPQYFIPISFYRITYFFCFSLSLFFSLSLVHSSLHALCRVICMLLNERFHPPSRAHTQTYISTVSARSGIRKYVVWCLICGGLSCLLGIMFLGVYFLVRSYTSTIGYFETVPTFVPATLVSNFSQKCPFYFRPFTKCFSSVHLFEWAWKRLCCAMWWVSMNVHHNVFRERELKRARSPFFFQCLIASCILTLKQCEP